MDIRIVPGPLNGTVSAHVSKSEMHRALICAAFSDRPTAIEYPQWAEELPADIVTTMSCINALGASCSAVDGGVRIIPSKVIPKHPVLECEDSGSSLRFLLPTVAAMCDSAEFRGSEGLASRPVSGLIESLEACGARLSGKALPIRIEKKICSNIFLISGNISSQYVSGLLFAGALMPGIAEIEVQHDLGSSAYVELTARILGRFGAEVIHRDSTYLVSGPLRSPGTIHVGGDWSSAAAILTAAAASPGSEVTVTGLDNGSFQADRAVVDALAGMGARVSSSDQSVTVSGSVLHGTEIDVDQMPDLFTVLAAAGAGAEGVSVFRKCSRLRYKESDRIESMLRMMRSFGTGALAEGDVFTVTGGRYLCSGVVDPCGDHRIVMAAAVAAYSLGTETVILDAECIGKSYPAFFDDLRALGGNINEI